MSRYVYEAYTRVWWAESISDPEAPTVGELSAATDITNYLTKDGLSTPQNQNMVDSATIAETFDAQLAGSWGGALELTCFRDNDEDDAWDLFVYGETGYLVVRRGIAVSEDVETSQKVEVYPAQMHQPIMQPSAANEQQRFAVSLAVTAEPKLKAVVAADPTPPTP
jgi:hypothetical protein